MEDHDHFALLVGLRRSFVRQLRKKFIMNTAYNLSILEMNKDHYDRIYGITSIPWIVSTVQKGSEYLEEVIKYRTSWHCLYLGDFRYRLENKNILELGFGDGLNALIMASLGARVTAIEISSESVKVIRLAAEELGLIDRIEALSGDFLALDLAPESFDFIVGKAFLHHLPHELEEAYLRKAAILLRHTGEARFAEPAINSTLLDIFRWIVPIPGGRPSILARKAFAGWQSSDPHPQRDHSADHYSALGEKYFDEVEIIPSGGIQRFHRLIPKGKFDRQFRIVAFRFEKILPQKIRWSLARAQTIIFRKPKVNR